MSTELKVPSVGESISSVVVSQWLVESGQPVQKDAVVVILETDKINVEVPSPVSGTLSQILKKNGETAGIGDTLAVIEEASGSAPPAREAVPAQAREPLPAARRLLEQNHLEASEVKGSGKEAQVLKEDVLQYVAHAKTDEPPAIVAPAPPEPEPEPSDQRQQEVVPMGPLRKTVARRLLEAQQNAALLTTFNEVDMSAVMQLRSSYQVEFQTRHGCKLGFMSFFVKASIEALKAFPAVNAYVRDNSIVYHNYYDIGIAVGGGKGLVVPVLRDAERLSFAGVEKSIKDFAERAQTGKLKLEELQGGTFTISNGGVYGSMLSTPIVNPPQSGVLGLHKIMDRPIAHQGQVVIRPMMYLALTYDHRLVDGREAVSFLIRIKDCIENPTRILLEV